ncbi:MAG: hypothetical protein E7541_04895 [Ruminococcaceae bacterium]|nr:hypothetical protein [Oscillospiraceae bacterium]
MNIADSHLHIRFCDPDRIATMLDTIREVGVTHACLLALPYRGAAENLAVLHMKEAYTALEVRAMGGLHVTDRYAALPPEQVADALLEMGCDGIKLMFSPDLRRFYGRGLDDPYYDKMFDLLETRGVPLNIHMADPEEFWGPGQRYDDPSFPTKQQLYEETFRRLDKNPGLRVAFAHFFFLSNQPEEAVRVMETYPHVHLDLTPGTEMYYNFDSRLDFWRDFFTKYRQRILFGTDCNTNKSCNRELEQLVYRKLTETGPFTQYCYGRDFHIHGLGLDEETVRCITHDNYFRFLGASPRPVNRALLRRAARRVLDDLATQPVDEAYVRGGELIPDLKNDPEQTIAATLCQKILA